MAKSTAFNCRRPTRRLRFAPAPQDEAEKAHEQQTQVPMTQPITTHTDIVVAEHDGTQLLGDLYLPQGATKAPVLVGVHGGGWQLGNRKFYNNIGSYLAQNGIA